jgi:hypothetical protein
VVSVLLDKVLMVVVTLLPLMDVLEEVVVQVK